MSKLNIYNSMSNEKEPFVPMEREKVSMYVCGITVYDECHLGHARTFTCFDMIVRYFQYLGFKVNYVRNITDIDDKIINKAEETGESIMALTDRYIKSMHDDFKGLSLLEPTSEPKATKYITKMINLIQELIEKGFAYEADNHDIYFRVSHFEKYGELSNKSLEDLLVGARVEENTHKENPLDFVLWKSVEGNEPSWPSYWGNGRPGWHIECSTMAIDTLGETFDIHGGGLDLKFPHHENECAQSSAFTGKTYANYWIHTGFLNYNDEKMSKSLGNFATIKALLKEYKSETIRFFLLSTHYRSPLNFKSDGLDAAHASLTRLYQALQIDENTDETIEELKGSEFEQHFQDAMNDDFNTPQAFAILFEISKYIHKTKDSDKALAQQHVKLLKKLGNVLGILKETYKDFFQNSSDVDVDLINDLIKQRIIARNNKDWQKADEIRTKLQNMDIVLEDSGSDTTWKKIDS